MDEPKMRVITEMTTRVHTLNQARAAELAGAARHREAGDYTRAAIAEHAAHVNARMAVIYQEVAGILSGTWLPSPDDVSEPPEDNGLGVRVGIVAWAPPDGAPPAQLHRWREFCDALQQSAIRQKYRTDDLIPAAHETQQTGRLAPEDLPQPDALTAAPAEETASQAVARPSTPDRTEAGEDGRPRTRVITKRSCNGCGREIGDVTPDEVAAAVAGEPLPDVRGECPSCSAGTPEPAPAPAPAPQQAPKPETARKAIRRIKQGRGRHKSAESVGTSYAHLLGKRVAVATRDGRRSHGVLDLADEERLVLHPSEDGYPQIAAGLVVSVTPLPPPANAGIWGPTPDGGIVNRLAEQQERATYPDAPANGGPGEQERADDPSALALDGEITQAFPAPVAPLIDPDCRDGKCGSCVGGPCEHSCHQDGGDRG